MTWVSQRRTARLIQAAADGQLYYDEAGTLRHRTSRDNTDDIPAASRDADTVTDLITMGRLRRDESGAVTAVAS